LKGPLKKVLPSARIMLRRPYIPDQKLVISCCFSQNVAQIFFNMARKHKILPTPDLADILHDPENTDRL